MKKAIIYLSFIFLFVFIQMELSFASPGRPDPIIYTQPDGTKITIILKGDEFIHWASTLDGYTALADKDGFYKYAMHDKNGNLVPSKIKVHDQKDRNKNEKKFISGIKKGLTFSKQQFSASTAKKNKALKAGATAIPTTGQNKLICILVSFNDLEFSSTNDSINNLFNEPNYSHNGAKGSVRDYYLEASYDQLELNFDTYGPYTLSEDMAYYGSEFGDGSAKIMAAEALALANNDIDYSQYDNDGNGIVNGIYIIYAGFSESDTGQEEEIWPHVSSIPGSPVYDNMSFDRYGCSSELKTVRDDGSSLATIGVICHELGHLLGAPDFYDTNYETDGMFVGTGKWDLMAEGNYNNSGNSPAHPNGYIKTEIFNWATATLISSSQSYTLQNSEENPEYYYITTPTENEYFLLENKSDIGFDSELPGAGLLIYHVHSDQSGRNSTHPQKMYPVCPGAGTDPTEDPESYGNINSAFCTFPGGGQNNAFTAFTLPSNKAWDGQQANCHLTNINYDYSTELVTFDVNMWKPFNFTARTLSSSQIKLNWETVNNHSVIISAANNNEVPELEDGKLYAVGDAVGNSSEIVYIGSANEFIHTHLQPSTSYFYNAWAILNDNPEYSKPAQVEATTNPACDIVYDGELVEKFDSDTKKCWEVVNYTTEFPGWAFGRYPRGDYPPPNLEWVAMCSDSHVELISPTVNCEGYDKVRLNFIQYLNFFNPGEFSVSFSLDNGNTWNIAGTWAEYTVDEETICFAPTQGAPSIKFKWKYNGPNLGRTWYIGHVRIKCINEATNVELSPDTLHITDREKRRLEVAVTAPDGIDKSVIFSSSDTDIASVDSTGLLIAHRPGVAVITAMAAYDGVSDSLMVTVGPEDRGPETAITIRARGTNGDEHINLLRNGNIFDDGWALSTDYQDYDIIIHGYGDIKVEFDNDSTDRDVQIDYIIINGNKREAEDMAHNTGAYDNGLCGGGSHTEWLHCNGEIGFGQVLGNQIVIRARGTQGGEHIDLLIDGEPVNGGWWLSNSYQEYSAYVEGDGDINIEFDNDGTNMDVQVDWVRVNDQEPRQAENMGFNTAAYDNGYCGGGSYVEWMHCNGVIGFGLISDGGTSPCDITAPGPFALPSISSSYSHMYVIGDGPDLSNINNFTISWSLENNGLYDISFNTGNGSPDWYVNMMDKVTQNFDATNPDMQVSGTGISGLDGDYWVTLDGDNFVMVAKSGTYSIYCSNSANHPCPGLKAATTLGVENDPGVKFVKIYPNPSPGNITIEFNNHGLNAAIRLYDLSGKSIYSKKGINDKAVNINGLNTGVYFVNIICNGQEYTKQLVIE